MPFRAFVCPRSAEVRPGDAALVQGATAPQPAHTPHLATDEPHRDSMATTRPCEASIPRHAVRRQNPRQEPSAVILHAGICAGGRPKGRSLPRSSTWPAPVAHRRMLRVREERDRARQLSSPHLECLASAHHPGHARTHVSRRHRAQIQKKDANTPNRRTRQRIHPPNRPNRKPSHPSTND